MEDELGGLFNIDVDLDDSDVAVKEEVVKVPRDFQSEEDFQKQRREWKPKIEVGEVSWKALLKSLQFCNCIGSLYISLALENTKSPN